MLTFMPSTALAQEEDSTGTPEATEPVVEDFEIEQEEVVIPTVEPEKALAEFKEALNSYTETVAREEKDARYSSDIKVKVQEIAAADGSDKVSVGDKVTISRTWNAAGIDEDEGTLFWVTLPKILQLDAASLEPGYKALVNSAASNGFSYDVARQPVGSWTVETELTEKINA